VRQLASEFTASFLTAIVVMAAHERGHWVAARSFGVKAASGLNFCSFEPKDIRGWRRVCLDASGPAVNLLMIVIGLAWTTHWGSLLIEVASLHRLEPLSAGVVLPGIRVNQDEYRLARQGAMVGWCLLVTWFAVLSLLAARALLCSPNWANAIASIAGYGAAAVLGRRIDGLLTKTGYFSLRH